MLKFLNLYHSKVQSSWGLHITARHLRGLLIQKKNKNWSIKTIGKIDLPQDLIKNGIIKDSKIFGECLSQMRKKALPYPLRSRHLIVNLQEEFVFSRIVEMPNLNFQEMNEAIKWEAESNVPLPIDKVYLNWEIASNKENNKGKVQVFLSATPRNIVDELLRNLKMNQIEPLVVESESAALVRGLVWGGSIIPEETPVLILNLKEYYSHIVVFDNQVVRLSTNSDNSSKNFDFAIADAFKISEIEAEKFRQKIGWNLQEELGRKLADATTSAFLSLKKEINSAISFYAGQNNKEIKKILLTGEKKSKWLGFDRYLEQEIGLPTTWQKDWDEQIWPPKSPFLDYDDDDEYNICIGLALRKIEEI